MAMTKHGLVLSGGGAKGSWEAGAAAAVLEHYSGTDSPISVISGTSVGGLNAIGIAQGGPRYPMELWDEIRDRDVYRGTKVGLPWRLARKSAIYNSTPLWKFIRRHIDPKKVRYSDYRIFIHTTKLGSKQSIIFTNEDPDLLLAVYAGASVPGAFPPVRWNGHWLVDGGTIDNSPIRTLIRYGCAKITIIYLDSEMPADPIVSAQMDPIKKTNRPKIAEVVSASIESMMDSIFWRDLRNVRLINRIVEAGADTNGYRHIDLQMIHPTHKLGDTLDFKTSRMRQQMEDGFHTALWVLNP
jgi:NTE family protein